MRSRKACSVVMAPNIEQDEDEGRLDGLLASLLGQAEAYGIPVVYALSRKKLGQVGFVGCNRVVFIYSQSSVVYSQSSGRLGRTASPAGRAVLHEGQAGKQAFRRLGMGEIRKRGAGWGARHPHVNVLSR